MNIIKGNLIDLAEQGRFDVIVHGCNCKNAMGAGIAKEIKHRYPAAYSADTQAAKNKTNFLGNISTANTGAFIIVNAYTQDHWKGRRNADYTAIRGAMKKINKQFAGKHIGIPKIGAGLAGGSWDVIAKIIGEELTNAKVTLVIFDK